MTTNVQAERPDPWAEIAAELHRIAYDAAKLVGQPAPCMVAVNIQPYTPDQINRAQVKHRAATVSAVDAVVEALIAKAATTYPLGGGIFHHGVRAHRGPIEMGIYQSVADPAAVDAETELEHLRARVAELEARDGLHASDGANQPLCGADPHVGTVVFNPKQATCPACVYAISRVDPLGLGDGFDRSQTADVDETPVPVVGRRYEPHTGGVTEGGLVDETPAWQPGTGFFEPGRVPGIVGKDAPAKCDCIAYQASHNCADEGCRCGEDFPTSSPCTCSHDFEDHESDGYGTGGPCRGGLVDETPAVPHPSWPTEAELKPWESLIPEADRVAESVKLIDPDSSMEAHYDAEADGYKLAPHVPGCSCQPGSIVIRCRP